MNRRNFLKLAGSSLVRSVIPVKANPEPPFDLVKEIEKLTVTTDMHVAQSTHLWESWLNEIGRANKFEAEAEYWYEMYQRDVKKYWNLSKVYCREANQSHRERNKVQEDNEVLTEEVGMYQELYSDAFWSGMEHRHIVGKLEKIILQTSITYPALKILKPGDKMHWGYTERNRADDISVTILQPSDSGWWITARANNTYQHTDKYAKGTEMHIYYTDIFYPDWSTFLMLQERLL